MPWLSILVLALRVVRLVLDRAERAGAVAEGEARAVRSIMEEVDAKIAAARAARAGVDHGCLPDDDPYRRD